MDEDPVNDRLIGRGAFLGLLGLGGAGIFYGRAAVDGLSNALPSVASSLVPSSGWRIYTIADTMPDIDPAAYRLRIGGLVSEPRSLSLADLKALPRTEQVSDFHCVTGWSVDGVRWAGVKMTDLLTHVGAKDSAGAVHFTSAEVPYDDSLTRKQAELDDVILAYEMDGAPISRPHGAPVRLVMPKMYGYKSVKWVTRIELEATPRDGFWETHGYDADAWVDGKRAV